MSLLEQQNFLARLYTEEDLRREFAREPEKIGREHRLNERELAELAELLPEELNFFAETLFWKRLREVEKLLPLTRRILGRDFAGHFRAFAAGYNPQSIKKHLEDAYEFGGFLLNRPISEAARETAKFELAKLKFFGFRKTLVVCRLKFSIGELSAGSPQTPVAGGRKLNFAVWIRVGKQIRHFVI